MQRVLLALIVAVAFANGPSGLAQGVAKNRDWLLPRLKTLADEAALFDAARVENVLSLNATNIQRETIPQPAACSSPAALRSIAVTIYSSTPSWLQPTGEGVQDMKIPAFTINPAAVSGPPTFHYTQTKIRHCSGDYELEESHEAELSIGLPVFACYSRDDLMRALNGEHQIATDGSIS